MTTGATVMTTEATVMTTGATVMTTEATVMTTGAIVMTTEATVMTTGATVMITVAIVMIIAATADISTVAIKAAVQTRGGVAAAVVEFPLRIKMEFYVRFAKRRVTLQMSVGGDTRIILKMTTTMSHELRMEWIPIGIWTLALRITSLAS
jgi:hypothetical protein